MGKNNNNLEDDDPYSSIISGDSSNDKMEAPATETARQRKWRKFQEQGGQLMVMAKQGFIMGSLVGGSFGFIVGCFQAFQTRQLIVIPLSTIMSGSAFGFFMGCGSMIRSQDIYDPELKGLLKQQQQQPDIQQYWKQKYSVSKFNEQPSYLKNKEQFKTWSL
ncbi:hypothetical protein PPERSA_12649 [Pseudocohnilembus persalinus]|uniref:Reactive oxygen species modulator 1 n=1 Tax=Pseudocohnilembus persalinus TaxID=266149 RepID=A0A0V0QMH5_PSEPJ|nr:hypothetical protein PPERSA_12649 [Pseudocohnilembus persalinus]|eukprot:KRX03370.1 hypothetical protein PPERSA_12649 [Pseudocohnilembus persalinus]